MADVLGRYTLAEMRAIVRRLINGVQPVVDPTFGFEGPLTVPSHDQLPQQVIPPSGTPIDTNFSNEDINLVINSAITSVYVDIFVSNEKVYADETLIHILAGQVEYGLPEDMCSLRGLYWKDPSTKLLISDAGTVGVTSFDRIPMVYWEGPEPLPEEFLNGAPTYRRNLDTIIINEPELITKDNVGGILVHYIKWVNFLADDFAILETQFARIYQEVVVRQAAIELLQTRSMIDTSALLPGLTEWKSKLTLVVRNSQTPTRVHLSARKPLTFLSFDRRRRRGIR